jgi:hypothetical protein
MEEVLTGISLSKQSIDLIIAEVSLSSTAMSTLNCLTIFKHLKKEEDRDSKMSEIVEEEEHLAYSGCLNRRGRRSDRLCWKLMIARDLSRRNHFDESGQ